MKKHLIILLRRLAMKKAKTRSVVGATSSEAAPAAEVDGLQFSAMASLVEVDSYRRSLAAGDPVLNQALGGIELTLARQLGREVRRPQN